MDIGVNPTLHSVRVDVSDPKYATVRSQVDVNVNFIYDNAIQSSGSIRLQGGLIYHCFLLCMHILQDSRCIMSYSFYLHVLYISSLVSN